MTIQVLFKNPDTGQVYDLTTNLVNFGSFQKGSFKKVQVIVRNNDVNRNCRDVVCELVEHPTHQLGTAEDTYEAAGLSLSESGTYTNPLTVGTMSPGEDKDMWIMWTVSEGALPGYGQFAVKATGEYDV